MTLPIETRVTVGWIAPMALELAPAVAMLEDRQEVFVPGDDTRYHVGRIGAHWVVIAVCPAIGTHAAAIVVTKIRHLFPQTKHVLVVGIGGGVPAYGQNLKETVVLGDVVISVPRDREGGVVNYSSGAWEDETKLSLGGHLHHPSDSLLCAVNNLRNDHLRAPPSGNIPHTLCETQAALPEFQDPGAELDLLFPDDYQHGAGPERLCEGICELARSTRRCDRGPEAARETNSPLVHYGTIGSSDTLVMSSAKRNQLYNSYGIICFEMESAGVMSSCPALVIRGICDYADSHKHRTWQNYAAATAAACAKEVLLRLAPPSSPGAEHEFGCVSWLAKL